MKRLILCGFFATLATAQTFYQPTDAEIDRRQYRLSLLAVAAGTGMDIASSWNRPEANALLRLPDGRFAHRGVALKVSLVGAIVGVQALVLRRRPDMRRFASRVNFGIGAGTSAVAVRNWSRQ